MRLRPYATLGWLAWATGLVLFGYAAFRCNDQHGLPIVAAGLACFIFSSRVA